MRVFPRAAVMIDSPLAPPGAEAALRTSIAPSYRSHLDLRSYPFEGELQAMRIDIQRAAPSSRNGPRVRIKGRLVPHAGGCRLVATADLTWAMHAAMLGWVSFMVIGSIYVGEAGPRNLAPVLLMAATGWFFQWLLFLRQVTVVRDILAALLNGAGVDEDHREAALDREPVPAQDAGRLRAEGAAAGNAHGRAERFTFLPGIQ